jgi:hypothetical protein
MRVLLSCKFVAPALFVVALLLWAWIVDPIVTGLTIPCPWYELTSSLCPGCGLQRATHALLQGDFLAAINHNLLSPLLLPLAFAAALVFHLQRCYGMAAERFALPSLLTWTLVAVVIAYWIIRNLPACTVP